MPDLNLASMKGRLKAKRAAPKKEKKPWRINRSTARVFASAFVVCIFLFTYIYARVWGEYVDRLSAMSSSDIFKTMDLETLNGDRFTGSNLKDARVTLFNVWGTDCSPCIMEMPDLEELNHTYEGDIQIVGIVSDIVDENANLIPKKAEEAQKIMDKAGATFPALIMDKGTYAFLKTYVIGTPTTFFVDQEGNIIKTVTGRNSLKQWKKHIEEVLASV